jgi:hypothetical protein
MKKASGFYADSLEMLLDTMCNLLGAVVFIALVMAILVQDTPPDPPPPSNPQFSNDLAVLTVSNTMTDAEIQEILARMREPRLVPATNHSRLPNPSRTSKTPWHVIVRHGMLYPVQLCSKDGRGKFKPLPNYLTVDQSLDSNGGTLVTPKTGANGEEPGLGVTNMVQAFKMGGNTNYYFVFYPYADSFDAFRRARETAVLLGFQYGWEPVPGNDGVGFRRGGFKPPPQ